MSMYIRWHRQFSIVHLSSSRSVSGSSSRNHIRNSILKKNGEDTAPVLTPKSFKQLSSGRNYCQMKIDQFFFLLWSFLQPCNTAKPKAEMNAWRMCKKKKLEVDLFDPVRG